MTQAAVTFSHFLAAKRGNAISIQKGRQGTREVDWPRACKVKKGPASNTSASSGRWQLQVQTVPTPDRVQRGQCQFWPCNGATCFQCSVAAKCHPSEGAPGHSSVPEVCPRTTGRYSKDQSWPRLFGSVVAKGVGPGGSHRLGIALCNLLAVQP